MSLELNTTSSATPSIIGKDTLRAPETDGDTQPIRTVLRSAEGLVEIIPLAGQWSEVILKPHDPTLFIPRTRCRTSLPVDIIQAFLDISFSRLCDSLARYDDPEYVARVLRTQISAYVHPSALGGKRLLDFGCGSGASTLCLGAMFPDLDVVGVELDPKRIELARKVQAVRNLDNVRFYVSADPNTLPEDLGLFDFVVLSAVYEHLLPQERRLLMPLIWSAMRDGGVLFVNQTPHRYFPYEHHSTGLWFVNYLPAGMCLMLANHLSKINPEVNHSRDWATHLRGGIRGGTESELLRNLTLAKAGRPVVMQPLRGDRASYWLSCTSPNRHRLLKRSIAAFFRLSDRLWGTVPSLNLDVAIRKQPS